MLLKIIRWLSIKIVTSATFVVGSTRSAASSNIKHFHFPMKIKKITLQNYKKFEQSTTFSFTDTDGEINEKTLIIGNNGSGKSSILQAIVCVIASATRENFTPESLDWAGYEFRHLQTGNLPLQIEAEVLFSDEEISTTQQYANKLREMGMRLGTPPAQHHTVTLYLDFQTHRVRARESLAAFNQFSGYQYAKNLASISTNKISLFENVGNIYWYTEQRNSYSLSNLLPTELPQIDFIRAFLANAYSYHLAVKRGERTIREGEFDFYDRLQTMYSKVFTGRTFVGTTPRFDIYEQSKVPDFFLSDGHNQYELSGMSAGERAIFPMLMDFARWNINNSIIIIDEAELHLHPPLQQTLIRVLTQLGNNNQFIFTTHSNSVTSMFDELENQIIRLPNG